MKRKYQPSNGTEGIHFTEENCMQSKPKQLKYEKTTYSHPSSHNGELGNMEEQAAWRNERQL